jgi:hypothetical protein
MSEENVLSENAVRRRKRPSTAPPPAWGCRPQQVASICRRTRRSARMTVSRQWRFTCTHQQWGYKSQLHAFERHLGH